MQLRYTWTLDLANLDFEIAWLNFCHGVQMRQIPSNGTSFTVTLHSLLSQTVILLLLVHRCWPLVQCAGKPRVVSELNMVLSATLEGCKELSLTTVVMLGISWHRENMGDHWGCARETADGMTQQQYVFLWKVLPILSHCSMIAAYSNSIDQ